MCPKGLKPTITSRFKKPREEIEFVSHEMILSRSNVAIEPNQARFRCSPFLTKHEIQEYMSKLYRMPMKNNEKPHLVNHMGKVMTDH